MKLAQGACAGYLTGIKWICMDVFIPFAQFCAQVDWQGFERTNGSFREDKEASRMTTLIFLVLILAVVSWYLWNWRKTQVEANRARQEIQELRKKQRQEAISPEDMTWPTVGLSTGSDLEEDTDIEEPVMTEIEFVPPEKIS